MTGCLAGPALERPVKRAWALIAEQKSDFDDAESPGAEMTLGGVAADLVDKIVVAKTVLRQTPLQRSEAHTQRRSNGRKRRFPLLHDRLHDQRDLVDQAADDEP